MNFGLITNKFTGLFCSRSSNIISNEVIARSSLKSLHLGCISFVVEKSSLAVLRKDTGFSLSNCKKALELHDGDINLSKEWLKKEAQQQGWAKATKLSGRVTTQGLVGFHIGSKVASLVEVNCETDFVARNQEFQDLVSNIAKELCLSSFSLNEKNFIDKDELGGIRTTDGTTTLSDLVALTVGKIGENIQLKRGASILRIPGTQVVGYAHPSSIANPSKVGKYGAVVVFKNLGDNAELAKDICAHIIGRNPTEIGSMDEIVIGEPKITSETAGDKPSDNSEDVEDETTLVTIIEDENETTLLKQKFVSDNDVTVGEVLKVNGIEIVSFLRFQVGELEPNT